MDINNKQHSQKPDLKNPKDSDDFKIVLVGIGKKVLGFKTPTDGIIEILKSQNCKVTQVEVNSNYTKQLEKTTDKIIVNDIETLNFEETLGSEKFDVILLGDILVRIKNPEQLLKKLKGFLLKNGYIVCSIPNIAHVIIRIKLLNGEFGCNSKGLFDDSNLRFFTLDTILSMLVISGYSINKLYRVKEDINLEHNADLKHYTVPKELLESIMKDPEATTSQYVFSAIPTLDNNLATKELLREFSKDITTERLGELLHYYRDDLPQVLHKQVQEKDSEVATLRKALQEKDSEVATLRKVLQEKDSEVATLRKVLQEKDSEVQEIRNSFVWRTLRKFDNILRRK